MTFYRFEDPWLFLLLLVIPLIAWRNHTTRPSSIHYSSLESLRTVRSNQVDLLAAIPVALRYLAIILLVFALARPQEGNRRTEIISQGVDIILAIDTSGSMSALDFATENNQITRLDVVKEVVADFINHRENDRMGMVVFGNEAFTQCPLTLDHGILHSLLKKLKIGVAGDATAIGSAIGISVKRLKDPEAKSKVVILLTDGRNNAGNITPAQAAEIAKTFGIKIYTIGVGTKGKAPFLVDSIFGKRYVYQQVDVDEETLQNIAELTGAQYFRATDPESLSEIYDQINSMEKSEVKVLDHSEYKELYPYFLIPALVLVLMEILVANTRLRTIP